MNKYIIQKAYPWTSSNELEIISKGINYAELGEHVGCQTMNRQNNDAIRKKCIKVADLIREIDELNNTEENGYVEGVD